MKALAVCGSKRKSGNTAFLLTEALKTFADEGFETRILYLGDMDFEGCRGCEGCAVTNRCVIQDDMQRAYSLIRESQVFLAGSPTYFYNMSSDMKCFIDRCYCFTSFDRSDRSAWVSELEGSPVRYAGLISICEQTTEDDLGFTADAMAAAFSSLGYRIVFNQKVLHAFKAGDVKKQEDTLSQTKDYAGRLLRTVLLSQNL